MKIFEMKLDKSADITGKFQLLLFRKFFAKEEIAAQFLFCLSMLTTSKGKIFLIWSRIPLVLMIYPWILA